MQQSDFELKNKYQFIPIAIAAILAAVVGCVTHFFKIDLQNVRPNTISLFTALGTLLLYGYDLDWMKNKIFELAEAVTMADVRFSAADRKALFINLIGIVCYMLLSVIL